MLLSLFTLILIGRDCGVCLNSRHGQEHRDQNRDVGNGSPVGFVQVDHLVYVYCMPREKNAFFDA